MKKILLGAVLALAVCPLSFGAVLSNQELASCNVDSDCTINGLDLTGSLRVTSEGRSSDLKLVGAGLRSKKFILSLPIYVAQLYAIDPSKVDRSADKVIDSMASQPVVAMTLTFSYEATGAEIRNAFQDALTINQVPESPQLQALLDAVLNGGTTKKGKTMTFIGETLSPDKTVVTFESTQGVAAKPIYGDGNFVRQLMTLWLGKSNEKELQNLKTDLLRDRGLN